MSTAAIAPAARLLPAPGQVVRCRTRIWLVEEVEPSAHGTKVSLACLDDDAQGDALEVIWQLELDAEILDREAWKQIGAKGFDDPRLFSAFVRALRWHCVTATGPTPASGRWSPGSRAMPARRSACPASRATQTPPPPGCPPAC